jgi:two-component system, NarL family, sensor histidine kinase DesK
VRLSSLVDEPAHVGGTDAARRLRLVAGIGLGLLFLTGPIADLAHSSLSAARTGVIAFGLAAFIAVYAVVMRPADGRRQFGKNGILVGLALLLAITLGIRLLGAPNSFDLLFVFFAAGVGMRLQWRAAIVVIGATAAGVAIATSSLGESSSSTGAKTLSVIAIGFMMLAFARQIRINAELHKAREEIGRLAVSQERLRIARDLHDLLGHSLSVINLKSELAGKLIEHDPKRAAAELADVQTVGRQALAEVRDAVQGYRQLALDDALAGARTALSAAGIAYDLDGDVPSLPDEIEEMFAWAVREGTTNVLRHSGAAHCAVRIRNGDGNAVVEVEDDGPSPVVQPEGSGLAGLAERAERLHGRLEAGVAPSGGFRLRVVVPLPA